ncbi:type VI secretion system lipoprotein TssJ [Buttiauxella brennerae]|uniref:type VI secretion system lipoprotein TssJ n=1 Tax=Buttiauxella brennerae TaxID=82988 RepID=UPI00286EED8C|nr:type VI secretion system lipoprotein TssJ [Buttiauxella brennerae]
MRPHRSPWRALLLALPLATLLAGCGLTQKVSQGTASATRALFYPSVDTLHLEFSARAALNADDTGIAVPTVVRVYALGDRTAFDAASYQQLLTQADSVLNIHKADTKEVRVMPGYGATLNVPLDEHAQFVAVVALFQSPDLRHNTWRQVIPRDALQPDAPRILDLQNNTLTIRPLP